VWVSLRNRKLAKPQTTCDSSRLGAPEPALSLPKGLAFESPPSLPTRGASNCSAGLPAGFYETAGIVKVFVFVFAFSFSLVAFLFLLLLLSLLLPFLVPQIHLGLLYALAGSRYGLGA
jgi:hypothetical protein